MAELGTVVDKVRSTVDALQGLYVAHPRLSRDSVRVLEPTSPSLRDREPDREAWWLNAPGRRYRRSGG